MDIAKLTVTEGVLEIKHPKTGENVGIRVMLYPITSDNDTVKAARRKYVDRRQYYAARNKEMPAREIEQYDDDIAVSVIIDWEWYDADFNGEKLKFTRENALKVFKALPWFKEQITEEAKSLENFISA